MTTGSLEPVYGPPSPDQPRSWISRHRNELVLGAAALSTVTALVGDPIHETRQRILEAAPWVGTGLGVGEATWIGGAAMMLSAVGDQFENPLRKSALGVKSRSLVHGAISNPLFEQGVLLAGIGGAGVVDLPYASKALVVAGLGLAGSVLKEELFGSAGRIKEKFKGLASRANDSRLFKVGLAVNTVAAAGQSATLVAGITKELPVRSWGWLAVPIADVGVTIAARRVIYTGMKRNRRPLDTGSPAVQNE